MSAENEIFYSIMLYSLTAFFTILVNVVFFLRARKSTLLNAFLNVQYMIIIWLIANALKKAAPNNDIVWLWIVVQYLAVCMFGAIFLDFAYLYKMGRRISYWLRLVIYSLSGVIYIILFTNPIHKKFFSSYDVLGSIPDVLFYVHAYWSYSLIILGYFFLLTAMYKNLHLLTKFQAVLFTVGLLLPILINIDFVFGAENKYAFDLTPVSFSITALVFGYSAYRYRFLDIKKYSGYQILENMHEGLIIIDANDRIIYLNPIMQRFLLEQKLESLEKKDLHDFFKGTGNIVQGLQGHMDKIRFCTDHNQERLSLEVDMVIDGLIRNFIYKMERLDDSVGDRIGYLIQLVEITQDKSLLTSVEEKNDALMRINRQLSENITATKQLAVAQERSRVSKEIHDILGHTMTVVISLLEIASATVAENSSLAREKVKQSMEIMRNGFGDLKKAMRKNQPGLIEAEVLNRDLENLIEGFQKSGIKVDYFYKKASVQVASQVYDTVYRICQEGMTNALKHGKAGTVTVGLRYVERHIDLFIIDDGKGCDIVVKGNGIQGMENRVREMGGYFSCGSPDGDGFNIHVTLPFEPVRV